MTDGPYKNLKLDSRSKRFAEAVQNEAEDHVTRCALASDAILNGTLSENEGLIRDLQNYGKSGQLDLDLDPDGSIKRIFDAHPKSEFSDHLQREFCLRLYEGEPSHGAISNSLEATLETSIGEFRTRIHEAGLEAQREGPMYKDQFDRLIEGSNHVIECLDRSRILEAIKKCDKKAFKQDIKKKQGLDEGPRL